MPVFSDDDITIAAAIDAPEISDLLNRAYRGEDAKKGWTTEAEFIEGGKRTNSAEVRTLIQNNNSYFLIHKDDDTIIGCINAQVNNGGLFLSMLSVDPDQQSTGIGKKLLLAAEELADVHNCSHCYLHVVDIRDELIDFYSRIGYSDTGKRIPFNEESEGGKHLQPLQFMEMRKDLSAEE